MNNFRVVEMNYVYFCSEFQIFQTRTFIIEREAKIKQNVHLAKHLFKINAKKPFYNLLRLIILRKMGRMS